MCSVRRRFHALGAWLLIGYSKTMRFRKVMPQRDKWFKALLTQQELDKLQAYADSQGWNMSQAFREWIKGLPSKFDYSQR